MQFAVALRQISPREVISKLTKHHHAIMEQLAESTITMVTTNETLLGTLEALESIVLEGYYHINCGNIQRAWTAMRRAVTAAQLLGLHRPGHYRYKVIDRRNDHEPEAIWSSILSMERVLSLLLGLPTSTGTVGITLQDAAFDSTHRCNLPVLLGNVTIRILERNQVGSSQHATILTKAIDRELIHIAEMLPPIFWRPCDFVGLRKDSMGAWRENRRAFDHMCYHTLVIQLHLPLVLCPSTIGAQREYSKLACVNASREILTREVTLRTFNPLTFCCQMSDILALIAGMTLVLAHVMSHCGEATDNLLAHQRMVDRATVERALECMDFISELNEDMFAVKCFSVLKELLLIEQDAAQQRNDDQEDHTRRSSHEDDGRNMVIMTVPCMFGAIKISRGGIAAAVPLSEEQEHDSITIGGIGSVHVDSPKSPDSTTVGDRTADDVVSRTGMAQVYGLTDQQHATQAGKPTVEGLPTAQHQTFPESVMTFDEWSANGLDTAFFDDLMGGVDNSLQGNPSSDLWDLITPS